MIAAMAARAADPVARAPSPPRQGLVRRGLAWVFRRAMRIYFRDIEETGARPDARTGGRIFVSNHVNALVDPILVITSAPCSVSPVAKSTLWKIPGLRWLLDAVDAVPIVRRRDDPTKAAGSNEAVFDQVAASLSRGHNVLIFPEGTSHNEPMLQEVKTGAARMLARAVDRGAEGLTFQAVALEFDEREMFRSRCLLVYGPVRRVGDYDARGDELVTAVTDTIRQDLSELLVEGATWPERVLIARVAEMVANDEGDGTLERWNAIGRQVEAARKSLRGVDDATVAEVTAAVDRYYGMLADDGLGDEQFARGNKPEGLGARLWLLALLPLAVVGGALFAIPYRLPRLIARAKADDPDETSTVKLGVGLVVYPLWAAALIAAGFALWPLAVALGWLFAVLVSPAAALVWLDASHVLGKKLRFSASAERLEEVRAARAEAMRLIQATRERLGLG
jgi:1-acyl-sn-glycerol-3-phosphate acyltransferase